MSQLINDLVDKTAAMVPGVYTVEYESGKKGVEFNEEALNRFVELIVRECMNLVKDCYAEPQSGQSSYQTVCASTIIEDYFGVEQ